MLIITKRFKTILTLLCLFMMGWVFYHDDIFIQLTLLCSLLIVFSFLWTIFSTVGIDALRKSRYSRQKVGEYFEEDIEVINRSPFWHHLVEIFDLTIDKDFRASRIIASIGPHQSRFYHVYHFLSKRGIISLGPMKVTAVDPFGFFRKERLIERKNRLNVLPFYEEITPFPVHFGQLSGGIALQRPSLETTTHAAGIREYQPGDPLNRIHWPSSMKKNRLIVKEFDQNPHGSVWIFLDAQKEITVKVSREQSEESVPEPWNFHRQKKYQLPRDTFEYAVSIAASLTDLFIRQGKQVGFYHSGKHAELIPAEKGERQVLKILDLLSHVQADGEISIFPFVESNISHQSAGNMIILITTSKARELQQLANLIKRKALSPLLIILSAPSFDNTESESHIIHQLELDRIPVTEIVYGNPIRNILQRTVF